MRRTLWVAGLLLLPRCLAGAEVRVAWFTDAAIPNAAKAPAPPKTLPETDGTCGKGVKLVRPAPVDWPGMRRDRGLISFWVRPEWPGGDGRRHRLLRVGDPARNGLLIEKSARGMLRFVMASPRKITAARYDVSHWRPGRWHQVTVTWQSVAGRPLGVALYLDEPLPGRGGPDALDGPLACGNRFLDPNGLGGKRVWIGDASARADMDELILRTKHRDAISHRVRELVYRDYYRTGPFARLLVDPEPCYARSDRRALAGHPKQFGLRAEIRGRPRQITDFTRRYYPWGSFDAKPLITWRTSDPKVARVDKNGLVTGAAPGRCRLTATFRRLRAGYDLEVISADQPDLDLLWLSRLPRYRCDAAKNTPAPGEAVQTLAHVANYGYKDVPAGAVARFELVPDANRNYRLDAGEKPVATQRKVIAKALRPREATQVRFDWRWTDEPVWIRVTLDPDGKLPDLCRANNQRKHLNVARPTLVGFWPPGQPEKYHGKRTINLVGSFSYYDYAQAQFDCFEMLLRQAVYPTTSPHGVLDAVYLDETFTFSGDWKTFDATIEPLRPFYDGHHVHVEDIPMAQNSGALHEGGHNSLALPDLYAYTVRGDRVLLKDPEGKYYTQTHVLPTGFHHNPPADSACTGWYGPFMSDCHFWLHPANAGKIQYYRGFRGHRFWGAASRLVPGWRSALVLTDVDDEPLRNAAVCVYQVANINSVRWIVDRPKFRGATDDGGLFRFSRFTDDDWDDAETETVEGKVDVWNPFGRLPKKDNQFRDVPFTPNVIETQGILLVKVVSGGQTEFHWVTDLDFQTAFFSGQRIEGKVAVRTSLRSSKDKPKLLRPTVPPAIRKVNRAPKVVIAPKTLQVVCRKRFTLDASGSRDPEGQPLRFFWRSFHMPVKPDPKSEARGLATAPDRPGTWEVVVHVFDGVRVGQGKVQVRTVARKTGTPKKTK